MASTVIRCHVHTPSILERALQTQEAQPFPGVASDPICMRNMLHDTATESSFSLSLPDINTMPPGAAKLFSAHAAIKVSVTSSWCLSWQHYYCLLSCIYLSQSACGSQWRYAVPMKLLPYMALCSIVAVTVSLSVIQYQRPKKTFHYLSKQHIKDHGRHDTSIRTTLSARAAACIDFQEPCSLHIATGITSLHGPW